MLQLFSSSCASPRKEYLVELKAHESFDESRFPAGLVTHHQDRRRVEWLAKVLHFSRGWSRRKDWGRRRVKDGEGRAEEDDVLKHASQGTWEDRARSEDLGHATLEHQPRYDALLPVGMM